MGPVAAARRSVAARRPLRIAAAVAAVVAPVTVAGPLFDRAIEIGFAGIGATCLLAFGHALAVTAGRRAAR